MLRNSAERVFVDLIEFNIDESASVLNSSLFGSVLFKFRSEKQMKLESNLFFESSLVPSRSFICSQLDLCCPISLGEILTSEVGQ